MLYIRFHMIDEPAASQAWREDLWFLAEEPSVLPHIYLQKHSVNTRSTCVDSITQLSNCNLRPYAVKFENLQGYFTASLETCSSAYLSSLWGEKQNKTNYFCLGENFPAHFQDPKNSKKTFSSNPHYVIENSTQNFLQFSPFQATQTWLLLVGCMLHSSTLFRCSPLDLHQFANLSCTKCMRIGDNTLDVDSLTVRVGKTTSLNPLLLFLLQPSMQLAFSWLTFSTCPSLIPYLSPFLQKLPFQQSSVCYSIPATFHICLQRTSGGLLPHSFSLRSFF